MEMLFRVGGPAAHVLGLLVGEQIVSRNKALEVVRDLAMGRLTEKECKAWVAEVITRHKEEQALESTRDGWVARTNEEEKGTPVGTLVLRRTEGGVEELPVKVPCGECDCVIVMTYEREKELRRSGEAFSCPNGHWRVFRHDP